MVKWSMRQLPTGQWEGMITLVPAKNISHHSLPGKWTKGKPVRLKARSKSKAGALLKAASVANAIANNPILSAALPPGSKVAIKAVNFLAKSAVVGKLEKATGKIVGKGAKRLIKALKFW